ncbi:porin [Propionivibrio sp.]|uniref:porin n=1 Tax=Propionivibrio sp. TaxID=2212460 RepID=UPI00261D7CEB|nr:porin [Propionivibrio sp.]
MQKKIIALAVAGLVSGAAFAQSNVTVYGIADAAVTNWSGANQRATAIENGGNTGLYTSRLGFKGEEDLGNGLKAIFQIESGVNVDGTTTAQNTVWGSARQANVGLTSAKFGTVKIGQQSTLADAWHGINTETMGNLSPNDLLGKSTGTFSNTKIQAVSYQSPNLSGFTLGAAWIPVNVSATGVGVDDTTLVTTTRNDIYQLGVNYANGPFGANATWAVRDQKFTGSENSKDLTVGVSYDFKVVKVMGGYYLSQNVGTALTSTLRNQDNALWTLGVQVPVGSAGKVAVQYARKDDDAADMNANAWLLGYTHMLSKRTSLYAAYARVNNDTNSEIQPVGGAVFTSITGKNFNGVILGASHSF